MNTKTVPNTAQRPRLALVYCASPTKTRTVITRWKVKPMRVWPMPPSVAFLC